MAEESFSNIRVVKAFSNEKEEVEKFGKENIQVYNMGFRKVLWVSFFSMVANFFFYGSMGSLLLVGSILVKDGKLTVG